MSSASISGNVQLAGMAMSLTATRSGEGEISQQPTLPKAWAGTLTTRTNDTDGIITTTLEHDVTTDDFITIFWAEGIAYYADVSAVGANTITFDTTTLGDVLPAQDYVVIAGAEVTIDTDFDGDLVKIIAATCPARAHLEFYDTGPAELHEIELLAGQAWFWVSDLGWTNPLTGDPVDKIYAACADITAGQMLKLGVLYNSVS